MCMERFLADYRSFFPYSHSYEKIRLLYWQHTYTKLSLSKKPANEKKDPGSVVVAIHVNAGFDLSLKLSSC